MFEFFEDVELPGIFNHDTKPNPLELAFPKVKPHGREGRVANHRDENLEFRYIIRSPFLQSALSESRMDGRGLKRAWQSVLRAERPKDLNDHP
ncbi:hypothetical protein KM043_005231 [Ampulex compressa]|nr:hypothetical protein KM043_005231 [Ampulex compressa]